MMTGAATRMAGEAGDLIRRLAIDDGSAMHPHRRRLMEPTAPLRDLTDLLHSLCTVHGNHPGLAEEAAARDALPDAARWLAAAADGFAAERRFLARLVAAAGPLPSTPGHALSEAALVTQRHALTMLGRSDRAGCATGAVAALLFDWLAMRPLLNIAADRFDAGQMSPRLPTAGETAALLDALTERAPVARAVTFGAQQLLAQNRALWDLLEARASARR